MRTYIFLFIALLGLASCSKFLDETPKGTLIPQTIEDFGLILESGGSIYNDIAIGSGITMLMDDDVKVTEDATKAATYRVWGLKSYRWEDHLFTVSENDPDYNALYHTIYLCNYILNHLEGAKEGGQFSKDYVEGAARFHRAFSYLYLVNLYAKHYDAQTADTDLGVALALEDNPNLQLRRSTVKEIYDQILDDALKAVPLLKNTEYADQAGYYLRASNAAAYALLARIYLYRGEYENCWKTAQEARNIVGEPADFNNYEKDDENPDDGISGDGIPYLGNMDGWAMPDVICYKSASQEPAPYSDYNLSDELIALFPDKEADLRWNLFVTTYSYHGAENGDEPRISSFYYFNNKGLNIGELYITEAEALVREGDIDGALDALNKLRTKRYAADTYVDVTERDPEKLLKLILDERRRELMFKGTRWFDLKRLNKDPRFAKTITHTYFGETYTLEPNSPKYVLPIPLKVMAANNLLEQNPR